MEYTKNCRVAAMIEPSLYEAIVAYVDAYNESLPAGAKRLSVSRVVRESLEFFLDSENGFSLVDGEQVKDS